MADENTMPEIPDDINLDDDSQDADGGAPSSKRKRASLGGNKLIKILMWVGIGSVVIIAEVVIAYMLINKFFMQKQLAQMEQSQPIQTRESVTDGEQANPEMGSLDLPDLPHDPAPDMKKVGGLFTLADVVVNPALSQGKRYFVVTVVCVFEDKKMVDKITLLEPVIQDRLNTLLSSKTVQWYSNYNNRSILKREVAAIIMQAMDMKDGLNIYITKYVIQ